MSKDKRIRAHDREAGAYDEQVRKYEYHAPEAVFGMCYEFVCPGEKILDIGIGTGLASIWFAKAGLDVYGIDGSEAMLRVCGMKNFAVELTQYDIMNFPLPYSENMFNHVVSCGLFHFLDDLSGIFRDVTRIMTGTGVFAFTVAVPPAESTGSFHEMDTPWGVSIFAHADSYISGLLKGNGYHVEKRQRFIMKCALEEEGDLIFAAYVAKNQSDNVLSQ